MEAQNARAAAQQNKDKNRRVHLDHNNPSGKQIVVHNEQTNTLKQRNNMWLRVLKQKRMNNKDSLFKGKDKNSNANAPTT